MVTSSSTTKLFTPMTFGDKNPIQLQHRVAMAPLTRLRAGGDAIQPAVAATYYSQRVIEGGLIVAEATSISPTSRGYFRTPGIFNQSQVDTWKAVTKAVHDKGGKTSVWAVAREGRKDHVTPRALETDEIPGIVEDYRKATIDAIEAGFDGVELQVGNGYLLEQFLCDGVNQRTDKYGGSIENRARFIFEVLDAITSIANSSKVGVRCSPFEASHGCTDSTPAATYGYMVKKLNEYNLTYLHVVEARDYHVVGPLVPATGVTPHIRPLYNGVLITSSGYHRESAIQVVEDKTADMVAFGRDFIATPDLVKRLELDVPLNKYDRATFYLTGEKGYIDCPFLEEVEAAAAGRSNE
ncbi:12-oxophytodienoate reductase, partial [Globisporangium splendens]